MHKRGDDQHVWRGQGMEVAVVGWWWLSQCCEVHAAACSTHVLHVLARLHGGAGRHAWRCHACCCVQLNHQRSAVISALPADRCACVPVTTDCTHTTSLKQQQQQQKSSPRRLDFGAGALKTCRSRVTSPPCSSSAPAPPSPAGGGGGSMLCWLLLLAGGCC